jgi:NAD kinase
MVNIVLNLAVLFAVSDAFFTPFESRTRYKNYMVEDALFNTGAEDVTDVVPTSDVVAPPLFVNDESVITHDDDVEEAKRKSMELMWCGRETCRAVIRERVVGEDNALEFDGPATGQVCYVWDDDDGTMKKTQSVFLLVKQGDDELMRVAAEAVQELTKMNLDIFVAPDLAAKLKHYYGVDDERIKLFEPIPVAGYGGNHVDLDDEIMGESRNHFAQKPNPDLVCTLGGDGLLMHASMMFQASCPPTLSIAGGSLGFLTRFSRDEMVEAIKISLGLAQGKEDDIFDDHDPTAIRPSYKLFKESMSSFNLGLGNRICISMRMRLDVRVINREGVVRARFNVLNEVVIDRGASPFLSALECFVDDLHLTTVQADGIIFAT